jgi:hypothetical protein
MFSQLKKSYRAATIEERVVLVAGITVSMLFVAMLISERFSEFGRLLEQGKVFFFVGDVFSLMVVFLLTLTPYWILSIVINSVGFRRFFAALSLLIACINTWILYAEFSPSEPLQGGASFIVVWLPIYLSLAVLSLWGIALLVRRWFWSD